MKTFFLDLLSKVFGTFANPTADTPIFATSKSQEEFNKNGKTCNREQYDWCAVECFWNSSGDTK